MRSAEPSPIQLLRAAELLGWRASPYNFDDNFDCWDVVQRVFDWVDDGFDEHQVTLDKTMLGKWFDERATFVDHRSIHTRHARATETAHPLGDDGGPYLQLWHESKRRVHKGLHARLVAGGERGS